MKVLYFGRVRDEIGTAQEDLPLPEEVETAGALRDWLRGQSEAHELALGAGSLIKIAINQTYADTDTPVKEGDEVAVFPPVTGG